jgi:CheY-like chemotaxis protein
MVTDPVPENAPPTPPRLLVVEDEEGVRTLMRRALRDYDVVEIDDAEGALDLMMAGSVDLVITDIALPRMDGCALMARIHDRWPDVPVIAISGYVGDRDVEEFAFDGFLHKPIDLQQLRSTVASLLRGVA